MAESTTFAEPSSPPSTLLRPGAPPLQLRGSVLLRPRRRVCLYTPSVDPSGMGGHMVELAAAWAGDVDVTLAAWGTPAGHRLLQAAEAAGARAAELPRPRDPRFGAAVERVLRDHRTEVFHAHVGTGREDFDGVRAARRAGVPAVVQTVHLPWLMGSPKHRVPLLHSLQGVDRVIAVSQGQRRTYEQAGVPAELLTTVLNGIRPRTSLLDREPARAALGLGPDDRVVLAVGRMVEQKGHRTLVAALPDLLARVPDAVVVVLGDGPLRPVLERQAEALGVAHRLRLAGFAPDARSLLRAADVFALPSRQEALPLAALEAMDAGLPVVATEVVGTSEVVVHGVTGLLVRRDRPGRLAEALTQVLLDPHRARRYGAAGRARFLERFTTERMAAETRAVHERALASVRS